MDFKRHEIAAEKAQAAAESYIIQAQLYGAAAAIRSEARVILHFTVPNAVIDNFEGAGESR